LQSDFAGFRAAMAEYGRCTGDFFSVQQGGIYSSPAIAGLCNDPELQSLQPVQSSWGPATAVFAENPEQAEAMRQRITFSFPGTDLRCIVTQAQNHGAVVRSTAPERAGYVVRG